MNVVLEACSSFAGVFLKLLDLLVSRPSKTVWIVPASLLRGGSDIADQSGKGVALSLRARPWKAAARRNCKTGASSFDSWFASSVNPTLAICVSVAENPAHRERP